MTETIKTYEGDEITLTQQPHREVPLGADYDYIAHGIKKDRKEDREVFVTWDMKDCYKKGKFELDDESNACDWEDFKWRYID